VRQYDVIVIGAGHNGLVAACYLAKAGQKVLVLENREIVGGCAITEEIIPGYKFSRLAYVNSLFRPDIIRDLKLKDYGFQMLPRSPSSFTPFPNGEHLFLGPNPELNYREISKFSVRDAKSYKHYEAMLGRMAEVIEPSLDVVPPDPLSRHPVEIWRIFKLGLAVRGLGDEMYPFLRMLTGSANRLLDEWFESEELKVTLATDAIIGAMASPKTPGTAYVLFHHVMGETDGARGVWGYVKGGMGALSESIASAARDLGVDIRTSCKVDSILVKDGVAVGVRTVSGDEFASRKVFSNVGPRITFLDLLPNDVLEEPFRRSIESLDFSSATFKLNLALRELPDFIAYPGKEPGPQHRGTIHIAPTFDYIERAYKQALSGIPSSEPILECTIPSSLDSSLAPDGHHVMSMFVQYAPYELAQGSWDDLRDDFAMTCIRLMDSYAPGFKKSVVGYDAITPLDMEREFALTGGNIFHGAMTPDQLFFQRPVGGWARYRTPVQGLYLCGAGTHPGGGVLGACGRNAAREALADGF
jgi:phytoene dehydrogenase-like protein